MLVRRWDYSSARPTRLIVEICSDIATIFSNLKPWVAAAKTRGIFLGGRMIHLRKVLISADINWRSIQGMNISTFWCPICRSWASQISWSGVVVAKRILERRLMTINGLSGISNEFFVCYGHLTCSQLPSSGMSNILNSVAPDSKDMLVKVLSWPCGSLVGYSAW